MNFVKSWGEQAPEDVVWQIHTFTVTDGPAFTAALDALMMSATGKKFPGQLHLSAVAAAGSTKITHTISAGYTSETEAEAWSEIMQPSPDWAAYLEASGKVSDFAGTFIIRTVKTWGGAE